MNLKPTKPLYLEQLWSVVVRKSNNSKQSRILPLMLKKLGLSAILFLTIPIVSVEAQITPDESLSTNVEQQGENQLNIEGGEREGNNLFHSFEEFSIPEGLEAVFENAPDIENIFTRITGEEASAINGILSTQGGANFFLVNPNGIVFGENAQLDVGGSFMATTAKSVQFEDGTEFIASDAQEKPILTVSVPIGLQFDENSGAITVNGNGSQISRNSDVMSQNTPFNLDIDTTGLSVKSGNTLALIGGNLNIKGGSLTANSGRIELGSVSSGEVSLNSISTGWALEYGTKLSFKDIEFADKSSANVSGLEEGSMAIRGNNVSLKDGSILLSQSTGDTSTGTLSVNASESLIISGSSSDKTASSIITETVNDGKAGDISVSANNLQLTDGGIINSSTFGTGDSGSLTIEVSNLAQLSRNSPESLEIFPSNISTTSLGTGNAGEISLSVEKLLASNGSRISSITYGIGNTGSINVNADSIEIDGITEKDTLFGFIGSSTLNSGNSGDVTISTTSLKLLNGAAVSTDSIADGNAGKVTINASESVEISGRDLNTNEQSKITSSVTVEENEVVREFLGISSVPNGDAGTVLINTPKLNLIGEGIASVRNEGTGNAGTLSIDAEDINLDNIGSITAETAFGQGGNINIDADFLQLDENSSVTATANNNGDGGNITINTTSLIAKKNSQITANAFNGRGGNLNINAEGLFLFDSPSNIFSASSELGIDGTIQINTPDIDLQRELEQSELEILTTEEAIASSCLARSNQQGSFTINNGSGMPKSPNSNYSDTDLTLTGMSSLPTTARQLEVIESNNQQPRLSMLPAEKMVETSDGRIFLVAAPPKPESLFCPQN
jgi:filamentous hemagglutinin family protein